MLAAILAQATGLVAVFVTGVLSATPVRHAPREGRRTAYESVVTYTVMPRLGS